MTFRERFHWCGKQCRRELRHMTYFLLVVLILFAPQVFGQENELAPKGLMDEVFIFRAVIGGLLSILIWVARGADSRIKALELNERVRAENDVAGYARLSAVESQVVLHKHEIANNESMIQLLREMVLTQYHNKEETERHRAKLETTLDQICRRIDALTLQRRSSDGS